MTLDYLKKQVANANAKYNKNLENKILYNLYIKDLHNEFNIWISDFPLLELLVEYNTNYGKIYKDNNPVSEKFKTPILVTLIYDFNIIFSEKYNITTDQYFRLHDNDMTFIYETFEFYKINNIHTKKLSEYFKEKILILNRIEKLKELND